MRTPPNRSVVTSAVVFALLAVSWTTSAASSAVRCPTFDRVWVDAGLTGPRAAGLNELSGIQVSLAHPGVLWALEDGNNGPHLYALDRQGDVIGDFTLRGRRVGNLDWEAIGLDQRPGRDQIYIGDIGDNGRSRDGRHDKAPTLYRIREPRISATASGIIRSISKVATFRFRYFTHGRALAPRNAEAMFVDPRRHDVIVITKNLETIGGHRKRVRVFSMPVRRLRSGRLNHAKQVATITGATDDHNNGAVSADISRDGRWIVTKNYSQGFLWPRRKGTSPWQPFRARPTAPCRVPVDRAEAISFSYDRRRWNGFWSVAESNTPPPALRHLVGPD
jgi:hypothetical protein